MGRVAGRRGPETSFADLRGKRHRRRASINGIASQALGTASGADSSRSS